MLPELSPEPTALQSIIKFIKVDPERAALIGIISLISLIVILTLGVFWMNS